MKLTRRIATLAVGLCALALGTLAGAQEMPVPPDLQAAFFKKIFDYDRMLATDDVVRVFVVHDGDDSVASSVGERVSRRRAQCRGRAGG